MDIQNLYPGSWGSNCYLLTCGTHAAIVDPSADAHTIMDAIQASGAALDCILLTHGHFDHIVSIDKLRQITDAPVMIHAEDAEMLEDAKKNAFYTLFRMDRTYQKADRLLQNGDTIMLGNEPIHVIHTPGHSKGSVCFLCNDAFLLTGDTLFDEGYGRYDLYGGNVSKLASSLSCLRQLPQDIPIYPGHGASAKLGNALDVAVYQL